MQDDAEPGSNPKPSPNLKPSPGGAQADPDHTREGAPTDAAHQEAGDGTLTGSVPAGLTADELRKAAEPGERDGGATG